MKELKLKYKVTKMPNEGLWYALVDFYDSIEENVFILGNEYVIRERQTVLMYHNINSHDYSIVRVSDEDRGKDIKKVPMMPLMLNKSIVEIGLGVGYKSQFFIDIFEKAKFLDGRRYLYMDLLRLVRVREKRAEDSIES